MESDGDHFLAYYLTKDDQSALEFKTKRFDPEFSYSDGNEACTSTFFDFNLRNATAYCVPLRSRL
jgi:RNA polymerase II-associated factor 1